MTHLTHPFPSLRFLPVAMILVVILVAAAFLQACTPATVLRSEIEMQKVNHVVMSRLVHRVNFAANEESLSTAEARKLGAFLSRHEVGRGDTIVLSYAAGEPEEILQEHRRDTVAQYLAASRLKTRFGQPRMGMPDSRDVIMVEVERYLVIPPACPDRLKPANDDPGNSRSSNFGCADASNLGLMVADPKDLIVGRDPGAADGERMAASVSRYRAGKETPILREGTR